MLYSDKLSSGFSRILSILFTVLLFISSGFEPAQAQEITERTDTAVFNIDNCVNEFSMDATEKTKVGYQYWFVDKDFLDGRTLKMSVVKPGAATHPPHIHTEDEFFFILEGKAEFYLNGKTTVTEGYTSFYCPANSEHGIRNVGDSTLKYLVIKKYNLKK